jgi:lysophospholipase L1-like esterase
MAEGAYGMTGVGFDAVEPAWAAIETDGTRTSHLEVHFLRQPGGGTMELEVDGVPLEIDTAFERRAAGIEYVALADGPHHVELTASGESPTRLYGFALEREMPGVVVDQLGVNGLTAAIALLSEEEIVRDFVTARRPDVVVVWLGANEASEEWPLEHQETNLRAIVARVREDAPTAACLVLGPLDRRQHDADGNPFVPPLLFGLTEVHRRVAREMGCAYFDSLAWQGGPGAVERFELASPPLVRDDRLHLTHRGYVRYGADLLRALLEPLRSR